MTLALDSGTASLVLVLVCLNLLVERARDINQVSSSDQDEATFFNTSRLVYKYDHPSSFEASVLRMMPLCISRLDHSATKWTAMRSEECSGAGGTPGSAFFTRAHPTTTITAATFLSVLYMY